MSNVYNPLESSNSQEPIAPRQTGAPGGSLVLSVIGAARSREAQLGPFPTNQQRRPGVRGALSRPALGFLPGLLFFSPVV